MTTDAHLPAVRWNVDEQAYYIVHRPVDELRAWNEQAQQVLAAAGADLGEARARAELLPTPGVGYQQRDAARQVLRAKAYEAKHGPIPLGAALKAERLAAGLSGRQVATAASRSRRWLEVVEAGGRDAPTAGLTRLRLLMTIRRLLAQPPLPDTAGLTPNTCAICGQPCAVPPRRYLWEIQRYCSQRCNDRASVVRRQAQRQAQRQQQEDRP